MDQNKMNNSYQTKQHIPYRLIGLMYQLDLSVLCSIREFIHRHKYPTLLLVFGASEIEKFYNIVIHYEDKSVHIHIENVDKYYTDNSINYARLFTKQKEKLNFFMNYYLDSFVKHLICKSDIVSNSIEYLIIYTNSGLDLTEESKLKQGRSQSFYPFKFDVIKMENCNILKDFLFTNDNTKDSVFYQFSQAKTSRKEFFKRLEFSSAALKVIAERKWSPKRVKKLFLNKLVFAVNQPHREELNSIVKREIVDSKVEDNYLALQERILCKLIAPQKLELGIIYEFRLLMSFLHDMFLHKSIYFVNTIGNRCDKSNDIIVNNKDKIIYLKGYNADNNIGYSQLFPSRTQERKNKFTINKNLSLFNEELQKDINIKYFIIYTNTNLELTEDNRLKKVQSKNFHPLKFDSVDSQKKKFKILRQCSSINKIGLYQFSHEETSTISSLLKLPLSFQRETEEEIYFVGNGTEVKEKFLGRLIFAVNQPNREELSSIIENKIQNESHKVPYNYEELQEIALRWSESHEFGPITKEIMEKLFEDIQQNRSSFQGIQNKNIDEEMKFAKSVVGRVGTPSFNCFLDFLIKGEGMEYLVVLKRQGISLPNMSSILNRAGNNAIVAFKKLYFLWFDVKGNKTQYLKTLEYKKINLNNMSSILNGAGNNAAEAFKDLFNLWFDANGNKTQYLKTLEDEGINLPNMTSILNGAGNNSAKAFKDLYDLWFDASGNKTRYLKTLEHEGVKLPNVSGILSGAGNNSAKSFEELYDLWFDEKGNKTPFLKTLENVGVSLPNMSSILSGAGANATKAFKNLFYLWFDEEGNKTHYLKTLQDNGVNLPNVSSILSKAGVTAAKSFQNLYHIWFNMKGKKTHYLKTLEEEGMTLTNISSILHGAAGNAAKAFKDLYNIWFDEQGTKTQHLKHFINKKDSKQRFTLRNLSSIFNGAGANLGDAFENLHSVCFNEKGKRTQLLNDFFEAGFRPRHLSCILCGTGIRASSTLKNLHRACFNDEGERTELLEDFFNAGFRPSDLCNTLGAAADCIKSFHDFCFVGDTKKYLNHFLSEKGGFMPSDLSEILHGARTNVCSVLKGFHDVCFDEAGNNTLVLNDVYKFGFETNDLSNILSMGGNNAVSIFENFCKLCLNKNNYLNHFLAEKELFTPKNLSRILHRAGINICPVFEKLHNLCFNKLGKKTNYLNNLITKNIQSNEICGILREEVKKSSSVVLKELRVNEMEDDKTIIKQHNKLNKKRKAPQVEVRTNKRKKFR